MLLYRYTIDRILLLIWILTVWGFNFNKKMSRFFGTFFFHLFHNLLSNQLFSFNFYLSKRIFTFCEKFSNWTFFHFFFSCTKPQNLFFYRYFLCMNSFLHNSQLDFFSLFHNFTILLFIF